MAKKDEKKATTTKRKRTTKKTSASKKRTSSKKVAKKSEEPVVAERARYGLAFAIIFMVIAFFGGFMIGKDTARGFRFEELGDQDAQIVALNDALDEAEAQNAELLESAETPESYALSRDTLAGIADSSCDNVEVVTVGVVGYPTPVPMLSVVGQEAVVPLNPGPEHVLRYLGHNACDYYFYNASEEDGNAALVYSVADQVFTERDLSVAVEDIFVTGTGAGVDAFGTLIDRYVFAVSEGVLYATEKNAFDFVELGALPEGVHVKEGFEGWPRLISTTFESALMVDEYSEAFGVVSFRVYEEGEEGLVATEETVNFDLP